MSSDAPTPDDAPPDQVALLDADLGLLPGEVGVLVGAPGVGKTSLLHGLAARHLASGAPVAIASHGTPRATVAAHLAALMAQVPTDAVRAGRVGRQDLTNLAYAARQLGRDVLAVDDRERPRASDLAGALRAWREAHRATNLLVIVESLPMLEPERARPERGDELVESMEVIHAMARHAGARVLVSAATHPAADGPGAALAAVRGPLAAVVDGAVLVATLDAAPDGASHRLAIVKHRRAPLATCSLRFDPALVRFTVVTRA